MDTPSSKYAIPRPADGDFVKDWPNEARQAIDAIDALMATFTAANPRPAAGKSGRIHRAADGTVSLDTGSSWIDMVTAAKVFADAAGSLVTALPGSPFDGQIINYQADAAKGVVWPLRYRAASASPYKWEAVGPAPMFRELTSLQALTSNVYADLATPGPIATVPLAGEYEITFGAEVVPSAGQEVRVAVKFGANAVSDLDRVKVENGLRTSLARTMVREVTTAATALKLMYLATVTSGGDAQFLARWISVKPVRVG